MAHPISGNLSFYVSGAPSHRTRQLSTLRRALERDLVHHPSSRERMVAAGIGIGRGGSRRNVLRHQIIALTSNHQWGDAIRYRDKAIPYIREALLGIVDNLPNLKRALSQLGRKGRPHELRTLLTPMVEMLGIEKKSLDELKGLLAEAVEREKKMLHLVA